MPAHVDVVLPAYNVEDYIVEAVRSVIAQTYPQELISVIVVDDGSTDRTVELVAELAQTHGNVVLLRSPHTGSPSVPRNTGLEHGHGEYVFFLDADDTLDPRALEGLVEAADEHGADVVLGRIEGMNDRSVPRSMFQESTTAADLVEHNLFFSLGPTKLFRRSLIDRGALRFPTDVRVGQDQPFVAEALLLAERICVLADRPYYYARLSEDPSRHLSQTFETATEIVARTRRVADIIGRYVEPGERRAQLLRRPFGMNLAKAFGESLAVLSPQEQDEALERASSLLTDYHDYLDLAPMDQRKRILFTLAVRRDRDGLLALHEHRTARGRLDLVVNDGAWAIDVPTQVSQSLGTELLRAADPPTVGSLGGVEVTDESVRVSGWVGAALAAQPPTAVTVHLRHRGTGAGLDVTATLAKPVERIRTHGVRYSASLSQAELEEGLWDVLISTSTDGATSTPVVLGGEHDRSVAEIEHESRTALVQVAPDGGGLRIDAGYTESPLPVRLEIIGLTHDVDGLAEVLMSSDAEPSTLEVFLLSSPRGSRGARLLLPTRALGSSVFAARLPEAGQTDVRATLVLAHGTRERRLAVPPSLSLARRRGGVVVETDGADLLIRARDTPRPGPLVGGRSLARAAVRRSRVFGRRVKQGQR